MVAPPPPPPQGPPPSPPPEAGSPVAPAAPPNPAQLQADLQAVIAHAQQLGVPPPLVRALLEFLARQAGPKFPVVLGRLAQLAPPDFEQLIREFAQTPAGQAAARGAGVAPGGAPPTSPPPGPGGPGGGPPSPPSLHGPGGPPTGGGPPPTMGPGGPPPGMMAPPPPEHPGPPPVDPADLPPPGVPEDEKPPPPRPWPFDDEIPDDRPARPTLAQAEELAARARRRWEPRNRAVDAQQRVIFLRQDAPANTPGYAAPGDGGAADLTPLGGTPRDLADGQRRFVRSAPLREFDRTVSLIEPHPDALRLQKRARRADDDGETAQKLENFVRAQWDHDARDWRRERVPHGAPPLARAMAEYVAAQGGLGFMLRVNPANRGSHPVTYVPIPVTELYPVGDWVLRITELPYADARAAEPDIPDDPEAGDGAAVRIVSGGDVTGRWHFRYWEWGNPTGDRAGGWLKEPTEINYPGFGIYQVDYWHATALPPLLGDTAEWGAHVARGIFAGRQDDERAMNRFLGISMSMAEKVVSPDMTTFYDPARGVDDATGLDRVPPPYDSRPGADNALRISEKREYGNVSAAGWQALTMGLSFLNAERADAQPPAMAGLGQDASGYQSVVRQEAGETLHVDPMRRFVIGHLGWADQCRLALCHQLGQGADKRWTTYYVASDQGEDTLTAREIALEGPVVEWSYREEQEPVMAAKQHRLLELHAAGGIPMADVLDGLGIEEPEVKHRLVLKEKLLGLPWVEQTLAFWELAKRRNKSITAIAWHALQQQPGGPPRMPGMPSLPNGPSPGPPPNGMPDPAAGGRMGAPPGPPPNGPPTGMG